MAPSRQLLWFSLGLFGFLLLVWVFSPILTPFFIGIAVAYLLDPVCERLESLGLSRIWATTAVTLVFVLVVMVLLGFLVPLIVGEAARFLGQLPGYLQGARDAMVELAERLETEADPIVLDTLSEVAAAAQERLTEWVANLAREILYGGVALFHILSLLVISPIVAFYLLRDWHHLLEKADSLLPPAYADTIHEQVAEVDRTLSGFLRGVGAVCLVLMLFYAGSLMLVGLNFGLVIGLIAGLISFIPFVGAIVGFIASVGMAFLQFENYWMIALVATIFMVGQVMESYLLYPRLVGRRAGLHPVWVIFALFAGGALFGFVGILVAVPVAAVVGVGVRFGLARYREKVLQPHPDSLEGRAAARNPESVESEI